MGVWSVFWRLSTFSRAVYQDADIYLLDSPLSTVDAGVSRHLFQQWVCSCFLSFLFSKNPVEIREESSGKTLCFRRLNLLCPGVPPSPPFPPQKTHRRKILHHVEVQIGKYKRYLQCVEASGVCALVSEGYMAKVSLLLAVDGSRHCGWIQTSGIKNMMF